jgi:hypothetical protein
VIHADLGRHLHPWLEAAERVVAQLTVRKERAVGGDDFGRTAGAALVVGKAQRREEPRVVALDRSAE